MSPGEYFARTMSNYSAAQTEMREREFERAVENVANLICRSTYIMFDHRHPRATIMMMRRMDHAENIYGHIHA